MDVRAGEDTIFRPYLAAVHAARRIVYVENRAANVPEIVESVRAAAERGVESVLVVPGELRHRVDRPSPLPVRVPAWMPGRR